MISLLLNADYHLTVKHKKHFILILNKSKTQDIII